MTFDETFSHRFPEQNDLPRLFAKLAHKYKTSNPLDDLSGKTTPNLSLPIGGGTTSGGGTPFSNQKPPLGPSPFSSTPGPSPSPFTSTVTSNTSTTTPASAFGSPAPAPSLFGNSVPAPLGAAPSPFGGGTSMPSVFGAPGGNTSPGAFGTGIAASGPSPFGSQAPGPAPSAFGAGAAGPIPSPFGLQAPSPSPFGSPPTPTSAAVPAGAPERGPLYPGSSPKEVLLAFYRDKNPQKIAEVDKVLNKYQGNMEGLFRNLAKRYNVDPARFGLPAAPPAPAFGSSFGQASTLGGGPSPFGSSSAPSMAPSSSAGGGFAQFAGSSPSFGGGGFGSLASPPGGGYGGFGAAPATPFGAPRR